MQPSKFGHLSENTLLSEILQEVFGETETITLEISLPDTPPLFQALEQETIAQQLKQCLDAHLGGAGKASVTHFKNAEVGLEISQVRKNYAAGKKFEKDIAAALQKCKQFASVKLSPPREIAKVRKATSPFRYPDIEVTAKDNRRYYIEAKRGASRYHPTQKQKDAYIARTKKVPTYVVRREVPWQ